MTQEIQFAKYQGAGNDFVMIADPGDSLSLHAELVRALCDRRFGIGADGVIRVTGDPDGADFFMDYVNSDGSIGEMCGNGIRCLAVFARDEGLTTATSLAVGSRAGTKQVDVLDDGRVRVDMGMPTFDPPSIPVRWDAPDALHVKLELDDDVVEAACLATGNPHAVIFVDDPDTVPVAVIGPKLEHHPAFPNAANVEFATVEGPRRVRMRVWERGSGETMACGTGACAVGVASRLLGGTGPRMDIVVPGGVLEVEWRGSLDETAPMLLTGPARRAFAGTVRPEELLRR